MAGDDIAYQSERVGQSAAFTAAYQPSNDLGLEHKLRREVSV